MGIHSLSMITDDPAEYLQWQQEQEYMEALVEQYHAEQIQKAEYEMADIIGCLQRVPDYKENMLEKVQTEMNIAEEYIGQIKQILAGANKAIIATILQPLNSAICESEWLLEASENITSDSRDDNILGNLNTPKV